MCLHQCIAFTLPRIVPDGRDHLIRRFTPAGYCVGINLAAIYYDKCVFGEDANKFNPPSWLDHKDEIAMDKHMNHFGAGLRTCTRKKPNELVKHCSPFQSSFIACS